jgi:hypothetical protein
MCLLVYLRTLYQQQNILMSNGSVAMNVLKMIIKEAVVANFKVSSQHFPGDRKENYKHTQEGYRSELGEGYLLGHKITWL